MKRFLTIVVSAAVGALAAGLIVSANGRAGGDSAKEWLAANQREVESQVLADMEKYGADIYRLHLEVSQSLQSRPGEDFGADKAIRKLQVSYADSHVLELAEASVAYGAIRKRDMLKIESYLEALERRPAGSRPQLMPNGYEIEPQLVAAQYNYFFHLGRYAEAEKTLDYLDGKCRASWMFQPQGDPLAIRDFVAAQRRILEIARRKDGK